MQNNVGVYCENGKFFPERKTQRAAAFDIKADLKDKDAVTIKPGETCLIKTGVWLDIPEGYHVKLSLRSSIALKRGLVIGNGYGLIDEDYVGELGVIVSNISRNDAVIFADERIGQIMLEKTEPCEISALAFPPEQKGNRTGGFGSTGEK